MNVFFKLVLAMLVLVLAIFGAFAIFGILAALFKWFVILAVVALLGVGAYKLLSGPDKGSHPELNSAEAEMLKAERMLAELRRRELTK
jgi:hypothetical protein